MNENEGVVTWEPHQIRDTIRSEVDRVLAEVPPDHNHIVQLAIDLEGGVNLVYGYARRQEPGRWSWEVASYVGTSKSFKTNLKGGVYVKWVK